jgi:thiol-disulfide isomerase/thioredoxin
MSILPNFEIQSVGEISNEFLARKIYNFNEATHFVANLDYGRNVNKDDLKTVFLDNCGTCSTKHALLKKLADENGFNQIKLILGIFKMNSKNTIEISKTLNKNNLEYIPEAHNYLKFENKIFDFTKNNSKPSDFESDLIEEIEMLPNQISNYKVELHKNHLQNWLNRNEEIKFNLNEIWKIREQCILDLSNGNKCRVGKGESHP